MCFVVDSFGVNTRICLCFIQGRLFGDKITGLKEMILWENARINNQKNAFNRPVSKGTIMAKTPSYVTAKQNMQDLWMYLSFPKFYLQFLESSLPFIFLKLFYSSHESPSAQMCVSHTTIAQLIHPANISLHMPLAMLMISLHVSLISLKAGTIP